MKPLSAQIDSACLSYRHDFGLLSNGEQAALRCEALQWLIAWEKEGRLGCDRNGVIEHCGAVVDQWRR